MSSIMNRDNMQSFDNLKPITSQVQSDDNIPRKNDLTDDQDQAESTGCTSSVIQCTQETSFSGLKYIFAIERTALTRYEICTAFI